MTTSSLERELKFDVHPGFEVPDPADAVRGAVLVPLRERRFRTTYYDTRDLRLARWGISLRCRTGEVAREPVGVGRWTVKLPGGDGGPALVRREVVVDAPSGVVPSELSSLVRAFVRRSLLAPVAILETTRRPLHVRVDGADLAEIDDDEVSVVDEGRVALRFRELEVELLDGGSLELLTELAIPLLDAGATPGTGSNKLARALGPDVVGPPEVVVPAIAPTSSLGDVARAAIADGAARLFRHDPGVRLGGDPEDVHQARVATRRLRSDLRTFGSVLDATVAGHLRNELGWLGDAFGVQRDADVLLERLRGDASSLDERDQRGGTGLVRQLEDERDAARAVLLDVMQSDRYVALLDLLVHTARRPPLLAEARVRASDALAGVVEAQWKKLEREVRLLPREPQDEQLHRVRIRAKRVRYAAEASARVCGKGMVRFARSIADLQSELGELNDSVVAEAWLRRTARAVDSGEQGFAAGLLVAIERDRQQRARDDWRAVWRRAKRHHRRWRK